MIVPNTRCPDCLMPFMDERLASCLRDLLPLLKDWEKWSPGVSETEDRFSPSQCAFRRMIGHKVLCRLRAAAEAASACTVQASETEASR